VTDIVLVEKADGVATVMLNRPEALNALNVTLKTALAEAIDDIAADDSVRAMLLTGAGRAFCAGGDISEMDPDRVPEQARRRQTTLLNRVFLPLHRLDKPVVAAVNGHAHGGGLALALACDIVLAGASAAMSLGYVQRGIAADCGILYFLPRRVGMGRAKQLLFTGRRFSAAEAERWGIVDGVVPDDELLTEARALTADLARSATVAIAATKRILNESLRSSFEDLVELEAYSQAVTRGTADHREGVHSFLEKRPASFVGK
jgi:2-(1,2-epoxy-1,2-dihydrophenyl)acetyl-CoA isomerase